MRRFNRGDFVVPKDEAQKESVLRQSENQLSFPCKVVEVEGEGEEEFLVFRKLDVGYVGLYAFRFIHAPPQDKPLDHYM